MDAAIWAEQQLVAILGWLWEDQNARLDQEGQLASIKDPRSPTIKKNKAKRITITAGEGEQDGDPSHSPPPPSGDFWVKTREFSEQPADLENGRQALRKRWRILK